MGGSKRLTGKSCTGGMYECDLGRDKSTLSHPSKHNKQAVL